MNIVIIIVTSPVILVFLVAAPTIIGRCIHETTVIIVIHLRVGCLPDSIGRCDSKVEFLTTSAACHVGLLLGQRQLSPSVVPPCYVFSLAVSLFFIKFIVE